VIAILNGLINGCWSMLKWGLLIGVLAAAAAVLYLDRHVDEQIRRRVEEKFAGHYTGLKVSIRAAELVDGEGIEVRGLSIMEPGAEGPRAELLHVETMLLTCPTDFKELLAFDPKISGVVFRRPILRATRRRDGSWSAARLLPPPQFSDRPPEITVENGVVEIFDPSKNPSSTLTLRDIRLTLSPPSQGQPESGRSMRRLQATLGGDYAGQIRVEGAIDPDRMLGNLTGSINGLDITPELRDALPSSLADRLGPLGMFRGQANLAFELGYDPTLADPIRFDVSGQLLRGRLDDPRLPHPLTDTRGRFRLDNAGMVVEGLTARSSQATLRLSCQRSGYREDSPLRLTAEIRELELDGRLMDVLPASLRRRWHQYLPAGQIDADATLSFDGRVWKPEISVRCRDASFAYEKFPYRMEHASGSLELKNDVLTANLTAFSGSQPVRLSAEVRQPMLSPSGWFEARGEEIQLDEKLFSAMPPKQRTLLHSLDPRGTVNFYFRFWRDDPAGSFRRHLLVGLNRCSLRYHKFPYPLSNIRGKIEMIDDRWTLTGLDGTNDTGYVTCEGEMTPGPNGATLSLRFTGRGVPLEEELRDALRPNLQQLWSTLKPQGMVDLTAEVTYWSGDDRLSVGFRAEPRQDTSIEPVAFPYKMEKLGGVLWYRDGQVTLERVRASHGDTQFSCGGNCRFLADGGWLLHLENIAADRVHMGRELVQALPERLKKGLLAIQPTGPVNLRGVVDFSRSGEPHSPLVSHWDVELHFHRASVDFGLKMENMCGGIRLVGGHDGRQFSSRGELSIDSLTWQGMQFTQILGPFWIDDARILLGTWVDRPPTAAADETAESSRPAPRWVTAELFDGTALVSAGVALGETPRYEMHIELAQADLAQAARDLIPGPQTLSGKVWATADLRGAGRNLSAMGGRGRVALREANVYELPVMIALLKILRIQEPNTNAFGSSDLSFRVDGNHIYFDPITFSGDAISLEGSGEMDFQKAVRLTFRAIPGRTEERLPLIGDILGGASEQIMLIHVAGTLQNPEVSKEPFPVVNQALQQLQEDLQTSQRGQNRPSWIPDLGRLWPKRVE